jgi:pyrroline-5-carboxylate reductase
MAKYFIGFLGTGTMGGALAKAAARGTDPNGIVLSDYLPDKAENLAAELNCAFTDNLTVAKESRYIFLGVKPQAMASLMAEIAPVLKARQDRFVLVSMAAGVEIKRIRSLAGGDYPVVRIMPNTPVAVGRGLVMYCAEGVEERELSAWKEALSFCGRLDATEEKLIDAGSALTGCGPAFAYMFMEALADGAVECGLPRAKAMEYAAATLAGAAEMALQSGRHPGALKDDVCSPGGSTIAGVHALESRGFRAAAMDAVLAAYRKTVDLGK